MKTIILTLTLLLVGCSRNEVIPTPIPVPVSEQWEITFGTKSQTLLRLQYQHGAPFPWVPSQPQPDLQSQPTKDEQVHLRDMKPYGSLRQDVDEPKEPIVPARKIKGYHVDTSRKGPDGNFLRVPVYEDANR